MSISTEEKLDQLRKIENHSIPGLIKYTIGNYRNMASAEVRDDDFKGISIHFAGKMVYTADSVTVWHWADVEKVLCDWITRILYPTEAVGYDTKMRNQPPADLNKVIDRRRYSFTWGNDAAIRSLINTDDELLKYAIDLVKFGFIKNLSYDTANNKVLILSYKAACANSDSKAAGRERLLALMRNKAKGSSPDELQEELTMNWGARGGLWDYCGAHSDSSQPSSACKDDLCIFGICGYLEYLASADRIQDLIEERKRTREQYRIPCEPYSFTWKPQNGLRLASESRFQLAMQLVRNRLIDVDHKLDEWNNVLIYSDKLVCSSDLKGDDEEITTCSMSVQAERQKTNPSSYSHISWKLVNSDLNYGISGETADSCVYFYAGYIKYLQDCGMQDIIDKDREWYHNHLKEAEDQAKVNFEFDPMPRNDMFMDESDDRFELAELLQEHNYVSLYKNYVTQNDVKKYKIVTALNPGTYSEEDVKQLAPHIINDEIPKEWKHNYRFGINSFNENLTFKNSCPIDRTIVLSAYVDYLRRSGQYEEYKNNRKIYQKNKSPHEGMSAEEKLKYLKTVEDHSVPGRIRYSLKSNGGTACAEIKDEGFEGISIYFTGNKVYTDDSVTVWHWADVDRILCDWMTRTLFPSEADGYEPREESQSLGDSNELIGKHTYDFTWENDIIIRSIINMDDDLLDYALELVKLGFIKNLSYDDENERVHILTFHAACAEAESQTAGRERLLGLMRDRARGLSPDELEEEFTMNWGDKRGLWLYCAAHSNSSGSSSACKDELCIFATCGYLEYAISTDRTQDIFEERRRVREEYRTPCGPYSFTWKPENGLRMVSESRFQLALQLVRNGLVDVDHELDEQNFVTINSDKRVSSPDLKGNDEEITACSMSINAEQQKKNPSAHSYHSYRTVNDDLLSSISGETIDSCVYFYAGYIKYLQDCGMQDVIDKDRSWYKNHLKEAEDQAKVNFRFNPMPDADMFMDEPDDRLELAELLQEHNYVSMYTNYVVKDNVSKYRIRTALNFRAYSEEDVKHLKPHIINDEIPKEERYSYTFGRNDFNDDLTFDEHCPIDRTIVLSAYVDYLRRSGQYEEYKNRRKIYQESVAEKFSDLAHENESLHKVEMIAASEKDSRLFCAIEGESGDRLNEIISNIAKVLAQNGKIDKPEPVKYTFEKLAGYLGHHGYNRNGDASYSDSYFISESLDQRTLYVLEGLKEFIYMAQNHTDGDNSKEMNLIDFLGSYPSQTYIIVTGEKRYIDRFLELSPQIKFLFGSNIIQIQNLSTGELYDIFKERLSDDLKEQLDIDSDFTNSFYNYIAYNRRLIPLKNRDLAEYLADYANNEKALVLPPDVYEKESATNKLDNLIGLNSVKKVAREFRNYATFLKRAEMSGMTIPNSYMHMMFTGNPGTGKTMVARIIGQMLTDLGIVENSQIKEVTARDLISPYIGESAIKTGKIIDESLGGVLFIDEAYAIGNDPAGREVVTTLIKAMEDYRDKLVVIFAGYEKEMHEFMNINPGLTSRIGYTFHFDDYSVEELIKMYTDKMMRAGFVLRGSGVNRKLREVCEHFREKKDFGNGRFVDQLVQNTIVNHAQSISADDNDLNVLTEKDIPDISQMLSSDATEIRDYEEQLNSFIGMENVKEKIREFAKYVQFQQEAIKAGADIPSGNLHMIFTGNPGTGKTTIARIMADMLFSVGVIKTNKMIEVERKDLIAEYVGQTAVKTSEVIERAMDGVLFIDEAYTLTPTSSVDFGGEAIATLIKAMEDHKNNLIVIFAGYKDEMRKFVNSNPGIESRIGYTFDFDDYTPDELLQMYIKKMESSGFKVQEDAAGQILLVFEYYSKKKNFGNGRFVSKMVQETLMKHSLNISDESDLLTIRKEDIPEVTDMSDSDNKEPKEDPLESIIGMQNVKNKLIEFENFVNFSVNAKNKGLTIPDFNMHMLFTGNPGTGKTTIARIIAGKLYSIGMIKENKLVEVERKDLIAGYVGQTAEKTADVIDKALGGILFIDEAYTLTPTSAVDFGGEAIATLIKAMEDHKDDLIVIFAGYSREMQEFVNSNPGIASRIGFTFEFEDYMPDELTQMFYRKMESNGFVIDDDAREKVFDVMQHCSRIENFGNGRFVDRVIQKVLMQHACRYNGDNAARIESGDIPSVESMLENMEIPDNASRSRVGFN